MSHNYSTNNIFIYILDLNNQNKSLTILTPKIASFFQAVAPTSFHNQNFPSKNLYYLSILEQNYTLHIRNIMDDSIISNDIEKLQHSAQDSELRSQVFFIPVIKINQQPKQSDIHFQCYQINKNSALNWKCKYCSKIYKQSAKTTNKRDYSVTTHGYDGPSVIQLKRKKEH